jgi:hypothetical protein
MAKTAVIFALAALLGIDAHALNKCTDPKTGKVSFQDAACAAGQASASVSATPATGAAPQAPAVQQTAASPAGQGAATEQRLLTMLVRERRVRELNTSIADLESAIERRNNTMTFELEALRARKGHARNNLAGATWEQSISTEMQAVTAKYATMNAIDIDRLKQMRAELETVKAAPVLR